MNILPRRGEYQVIVTESDDPNLPYRSRFPDCVVKLTLKDGLADSIGDEPSLIAIDKKTGQVMEQMWFRAGVEGRDYDLPAHIYDEGDYTEMDFYTNACVTKSMTVSKRTGHVTRRLYYANPPEEGWDNEHGDDYLLTADFYNEETGEHELRRYSVGLGDKFSTLDEAPDLPFPQPSP